MGKITDKDIQKYKNLMKKQLEERYIKPEQVTQPLFIVQNIISYDDWTEDVIYMPYVSTNIFKIYNSGYLKGLPNGLITFMQALCSHVDKDGFAFPSVDRLAEMTGLGRSTILSYIKAFANNPISGKVLFYKQTIKRGKAQYDLNMYYVPNCIVAFTDIDDLKTDEEKLQLLQQEQNETNIFEMPDITDEDYMDEVS
ncbi:helix-turn-helix domain-containing protein [Fictibacillus norfolkensis]|uniref:Helix-turn-helix domain-containing protein n=1 Tax=Fictibacillus norfolkensis TaxID=2762233 RepID=A0ABR8SGB4_9BACL|nr:helix-turn-helix domain-containing protein [Fictibacillus norfolkensis]MBD7962527.1 helix-turn-helix domain-containing protein [Fictibacillus norfolkensis]